MSSYYKLGSLIKVPATTATSGGTTTLTASDKQKQQFTGSTTQTVKLPDATTLPLNRRFDILNRSTGIITVQDGSGATITTVPAGNQRYFILTNNGSTAGSWNVGGVVSGASSGSVGSSDTLNLLAGLAGTNYSDGSIFTKAAKYNPEEIGGNYWSTKSNLNTARSYAAPFDLNGYGYVASGNSAVVSTERYDQDNNFFLLRANTSVVHDSGAASWRLNGYGYVIGAASSNVNEKYNDSTNSYSTIATLPATRDSMASFSDGSYGYAGVGRTPYSGSTDSSFYVYSDSTNAFYSRMNYPLGIWSPACFVFNTFGYVSGGYQSSGAIDIATTYKFDPTLNTWLKKSAATGSNAGRYLSGGASIPMGGLVIAGIATTDGGANSGAVDVATCEAYSAVGDCWISAPSIGSATRTPYAFSLNGDAVSCGGSVSGTTVNTVQSYRSWMPYSIGVAKSTTLTPSSILASAKLGNLAASVPVQIRTDGDVWKTFTSNGDNVLRLNEKISSKFQPTTNNYVCGGDNNSSAFNNTYQYNPLTNAWAGRANITQSTTNMGAFNIGGVGYLAGGRTGSFVGTPNCYSFNDITNAWSSIASISTARWNPIGFQLNGYGYTAAGYDGSTINGVTLKYDPSANSWTTMTPANTPCTFPLGGSLLGRGIKAGGSANGSSSSQLTNTETYLDATNVWTAVASLPAASDPGASFSIDNYFYAAGVYQNAYTGVVYQYDIGNNAWATKSAMGVNNTLSPGSYAAGGLGYSVAGWQSGLTTVHYQYTPYADTWVSKTSYPIGAEELSQGFSPGSYYKCEFRVGLPALYTGSDGVWTTKSNMLVAKVAGGSFSFGDDAYVSDGNGGTGQEVQKYSAILDSWVYSTPFPYQNQEAGCSNNLAVNGLAHRFGDGAAATHQAHYRFDPTLAVWLNSGGYPTLVYQHAAFCLNGLVYGAGGYNGGLLTTVNSYSDSTNSWTSRAAISSTVQDSPGVPLNGFGYVMGGSSTSSGTTQKYNDSANSWATKTANTGALRNPGAFVVNGNLDIVGGTNGTWQSTVQNYNDSLDAWLVKPSTPTITGDCQNASIDGSGYNMGGTNGSNTAIVYQYAPSLKNAVLGLAVEIK